MAKTYQHHLPTFQVDIVGEIDEDATLVSFRGIPYAAVEKRWTHSRVQNDLPASFDATNFGPRCVQNVGHVLVTGGESDPTPGDDEFKCLNLNVTVPKVALLLSSTSNAGNLLPVMVWIHGGGFNFGSVSVARYRALNLSLLAIRAGTPVVLVQIQYRLGVFGFVGSDDLASELASNFINGTHQNGTHQNGAYQNGAHQNDNGIRSSLPGSYGFVDQQNALQWVHDHIKDFGGDPSNVTAFGVSAGSACIHDHILSGNPLFDRAILMSGSAPTLGPHPIEVHEAAWQSLCKRAGADGDTPLDRLKHLRSIAAEVLPNLYTGSPMGPIADGTFIPATWNPGTQSSTRCKSIIAGDSGVEGIVMDALIESIPQPRFRQLYQSAFSDAEGFAKSFGFTSDHFLDGEYRDKMRRFLSVAMFQHPSMMVAESFHNAGNVYFYHFEEPSPYPGPTFGLPYHGQCALFIYQNHTDEYPAQARRVAEEMGRVWTGFAHGKEPWQPYHKAQRFMRLGPEGNCSMEDMKSDKTRDYGYLPWLRENFEEFKKFAQSLIVTP